MAELKQMFCIACAAGKRVTCAQVEVHHLLSGNRRRGHLFTIPLCPWHHRADHGGWGIKFMEQAVGPSLARTSKKFRAEYGSDDELLGATNLMLAGREA